MPGGVGDEVAVPLRLTLCGLPVALSEMLTDALREPVAVGANVTLIEQVPPAATVAPAQVSAVFEKSLAFVPPIVTVEMVRLALPLLVRVTLCAVLVEPTLSEPKESPEVGEMLTAGVRVGGGVPPPPPPPQAAHTPTTRRVVAKSKAAGRRRIADELSSMARANIPASNPRNPTGKR